MDSVKRLYSKEDLLKLLIPLMIENIMLSLMGTVDTIMVSNLGNAEVSGVSLVDSISKLILYMVQSIATGGTIICSQYLGFKKYDKANESARQVILCSALVGIVIMSILLWIRNPLLSLIFGSVDEAVMTASRDYFFIVILSYPFLSLYSVCSALYRSTGNSRLPMLISVFSNVLNITGNSILLFVVKMGVSGAALSTLISTIVSTVIIMCFIRRPGQTLDIGKLTKMRPDIKQMLWVLRIGIPTGIENSMFQLGKLFVQSTVSTLGTVAIASNAIVSSLELVSSMPSMGISIGIITVAGTCIGAGRLDEAKYFIKKFTLWSGILLLFTTWLIFALTKPVSLLAGLQGEAYDMTFNVMLMITIVKPIFWPLAFVPSNGMRAAGDGPFSMITASLSMWIARVGLSLILCRFFGFGLYGIWIGYELDWLVRSVINTLRFRSGKWTKHKVMNN